MLHGDGSPTRRYLFAGDATDAFDTILHRGQLGQIYNVGSSDEISNLALCKRLLAEMGVVIITAPKPVENQGGQDLSRWIKYTQDRPFNDHRYAVDATKLRRLGWQQRTGFAEGLRLTVEWYRRFGERWWGDISKVLSPFPVLAGMEVISDHEPVSDNPQRGEGNGGQGKRGKVGEVTNGEAQHAVSGVGR